MVFDFVSESEAATALFGKRLSEKLMPGAIVLLEGDLGAGKSVLAREIINSLGYKGVVTSPTFTLMNEYPTMPQVYHFDLYRLEYPEQLYDIGYDEYLYGDGISLIEWPSRMEQLYPEKYVKITILRIDENTRRIIVDKTDSDMLGSLE